MDWACCGHGTIVSFIRVCKFRVLGLSKVQNMPESMVNPIAFPRFDNKISDFISMVGTRTIFGQEFDIVSSFFQGLRRALCRHGLGLLWACIGLL